MSTDNKRRLEVIALVIALVVSVINALSSQLLLPYRMSAAETEISNLKSEAKLDHETLTRIDERTKAMDEKLNKLAR